MPTIFTGENWKWEVLVLPKLRNYQDFGAALMFASVALVFLWNSSNLSLGSAARMGPAYMPRMLCGLMLIVSIVLFIKSFRFEGDEPFHFSFRPVIIVPLSLLVFAFTLHPLGLVVAICFSVAVVSFADKGIKVREVIFTAAFMSIFSVASFVIGLGLNFPVWPVWFR